MDAKIDSPDNVPTRRATWARLVGQTWFWPTLVTLLLGLARVWHPGLWRDELRTWSAVSRDLPDLFHLLGNTDAAVALYYLLLHGWVAVFGDSAVSLRMPSVLAMAGAAAVTTLIARRFFPALTATVAGLVFAVIPAVSRYAQEARPYALTVLMAAVATLLVLRAIDRPSLGRLLGYALAVTGLLLLQVVAAPLVVAHALGVLLLTPSSARRRVLARLAVAMVVGVGLSAPVLLLARSQYAHQVGSLPNATIGDLFGVLPRLFFSSLVAGAVLVLAALALGDTRDWRPRAFLAGWGVLPIGAVWVWSNLGDSYWLSRYLLITLPGFAILAAVTLCSVVSGRVLAVMLLVLAGLGAEDQREARFSGAHDRWYYPQQSYAEISYAGAAQVIRDGLQPGDAFAVAGRQDQWLIDIGLAYHLRDDLPRDVFVTEAALDRGDFWPVEAGDPGVRLDGVQRIWVVAMNLSGSGPVAEMRSSEPAKAAALDERFEVEQTWYPTGLVVALLTRR